MGTGIIVCGLNGCGKSTLGIALAKAIGFYFIDVENLFFSKYNVLEPYAKPRAREEVEKLLLAEVNEHENFVFASVKGNYGAEVTAMYKYAVLIEVPEELRSQRVRKRSFQRFGKRMLAGGDLYEQEERFFRMAKERSEDYVEKWVDTLECPVIRIDGTKSIEENVDYIIRQINM